MWPRDLLPQDVPQARILTFGYDASVINFFDSTSHSSIFQHALNLLQDLQRKRNTDDEVRPHTCLTFLSCSHIVFILHSIASPRG